MVSVNGALRRARAAVEQRLPERSQQATLRSLGDGRMRRLVEAFVDAWWRADIDAVRELLVEDAVFSMPPRASWWRGREAIAGFIAEARAVCDARMVATRANGRLAVASRAALGS